MTSTTFAGDSNGPGDVILSRVTGTHAYQGLAALCLTLSSAPRQPAWSMARGRIASRITCDQRHHRPRLAACQARHPSSPSHFLTFQVALAQRPYAYVCVKLLHIELIQTRFDSRKI